MATAGKPHIFIIPGACHVAHHWRLFQRSMEDAGYGVTFQNYPANRENSTTPVPNALHKSIAAVGAAVVQQIEQGRDVVVIAHSAGGIVAGSALVGLGKVDSKPGVIHIAYLAAMLLGPGESLASKQHGSEPSYAEVRGGLARIVGSKEWFYGDVPRDLADDADRHLVPCAQSMSDDCVESICWHEIPSTYIVCEADKAIPPSIAEWILSAAQVDWDVLRLNASHSPFLSMPERLAAIVRWASGENRVDLRGIKFDEKQIELGRLR